MARNATNELLQKAKKSKNIEILWRKIKYEWMPFSAYTSFKNLKDSLFEILASIGKTNSIAFS